jgi:hypothetical protein
MWELEPSETHGASPGLQWDFFTFILHKGNDNNNNNE